MTDSNHDPFNWADRELPRLFIPGPVEVRPDVLDAQSELMIGHRTQEFQELFGAVQGKLRRLLNTDYRVYILASSGTGLWEAAVRNAVPERTLSFVNGAFSARWANVVDACGRTAVRVEVPWGEGVTPALVRESLREHGPVDAVTLAHNETSTGVISPIDEISAVVHEAAPDTFVFIDAVSSVAGTEIRFDEWELDLLLTSTQKALACPPGIALAPVSDRVLERAETLDDRGWYFDFLLLERYLQRNMTPATPAVSLLYALDRQLSHILEEEGADNRYARHQALAAQTREWALSRGFELFATEGFQSPTVTTVANTREIDVAELNAFLRERGMIISNGYGKLKGQTFRIAHMGDTTTEELSHLLNTIDEFLS